MELCNLPRRGEVRPGLSPAVERSEKLEVLATGDRGGGLKLPRPPPPRERMFASERRGEMRWGAVAALRGGLELPTSTRGDTGATRNKLPALDGNTGTKRKRPFE